MALDRKIEFLGIHPRAIVAHSDQRPAAAMEHDVDVPGLGVERILDELLDDTRRPLHHLAGGDAIDKPFRQPADAQSSLLHGSEILARQDLALLYRRLIERVDTCNQAHDDRSIMKCMRSAPMAFSSSLST